MGNVELPSDIWRFKSLQFQGALSAIGPAGIRIQFPGPLTFTLLTAEGLSELLRFLVNADVLFL